jgi:hypothetical protein
LGTIGLTPPSLRPDEPPTNCAALRLAPLENLRKPQILDLRKLEIAAANSTKDAGKCLFF